MLKKYEHSKEDPYIALLNWRNTPQEGVDATPVQRLMDRRTTQLKIVGVAKACSRRSWTTIGVTSMNRRRSVHFRDVIWPSHRPGIGIEWAWTLIPRPKKPCPCLKFAGDSSIAAYEFLLKKTLHCTDDATYHVTSPVKCNGLFKNKSLYGIGFRIRSNSLQYTA